MPCPARLRHVSVLAAVASIVVVVLPAPRASADAGDGSLLFAGTASLPTFPCPPPDAGESPCVGTFTASTLGRIAGLHGSIPWHVSLQSLTDGEFAYSDLLEPGVPCSEGVATGSASLDTETNGQAFGTYHEGIAPLPVRNASISYRFTWVRRGATALLDVREVTIRLQVDDLGWVTVREDGRAAAVAAFLPHVGGAPPSGCLGGDATPLEGSFFGAVAGVTAPS